MRAHQVRAPEPALTLTNGAWSPVDPPVSSPDASPQRGSNSAPNPRTPGRGETTRSYPRNRGDNLARLQHTRHAL